MAGCVECSIQCHPIAFLNANVMLNKTQHDVYRPLIANGPDVTRMTSGDFGLLLCLLVFLVLLAVLSFSCFVLLAAFEDLF